MKKIFALLTLLGVFSLSVPSLQAVCQDPPERPPSEGPKPPVPPKPAPPRKP